MFSCCSPIKYVQLLLPNWICSAAAPQLPSDCIHFSCCSLAGQDPYPPPNTPLPWCTDRQHTLETLVLHLCSLCEANGIKVGCTCVHILWLPQWRQWDATNTCNRASTEIVGRAGNYGRTIIIQIMYKAMELGKAYTHLFIVEGILTRTISQPINWSNSVG